MDDESRPIEREASRHDALHRESRYAPPARTTGAAVPPDALPLADVLVTGRLAARPPRPPDDAAESRALRALAAVFGRSARAALDTLVREALALCRPDGNATTGVSLLEADAAGGPGVLRWTAMAGRLSHAVGGSTPREFSPCGVCMDQDRPVLFARPDLRFTYFLGTGVPFVEALVLPFRVGGRVAGTIWIVTHDDARPLDGEDVRIMTGLADFTGAVYEQLRAREAADAARADREQLLQTVSHEWRTPLGAIVGMTSLVSDGIAGPVTQEQRVLLARARAAADHLLALVNDTLARSRPGAGAPAAHADVLDVGSLVGSMAEIVEPSARAAGVALETHLPASPTLVHADATKVRQVVLNLLANAVKFTPAGRVVVHVEVAEGDDALVRVVVRDTGIGIAPEDLAYVFERYWRATGTATPPDDGATAGAGLGLAISRDLAREMGGDLTAESEVGAGSTFTLVLPRARGA